MPKHFLQAAAFPTLDEAQMAQLRRCSGASLEQYPAGRVLFDVGDRDFKFFVVKSGEVEILDPSDEPPKTIAIHGPGKFTGEVAHLTGTPSLVRAVARTACELYAISSAGLREAAQLPGARRPHPAGVSRATPAFA